MTTYTIMTGYNSSFSEEEVWKEILDVAIELCENYFQIAIEAIRIDTALDPLSIVEFAKAFKNRTDSTILFKENKIEMLASGGGESRFYKESLRRAFCRLIMEQLHAKQMEVTIIVG